MKIMFCRRFRLRYTPSQATFDGVVETVYLEAQGAAQIKERILRLYCFTQIQPLSNGQLHVTAPKQWSATCNIP